MWVMNLLMITWNAFDKVIAQRAVPLYFDRAWNTKRHPESSETFSSVHEY